MQLSNSVKHTLALYLQRNNLSQCLSSSTFYRHAKELKKYGIDITKPYKSKDFRVYSKSDVCDLPPFFRIEKE